MKRVYIFITLSFIIGSCTESKVEEEDTQLEHTTEQIIHQIPEGDLEILTIDNCEYIVFKDFRGTNHGFGYMAHKGNCKNPIHIYNDTLSEELKFSEENID